MAALATEENSYTLKDYVKGLIQSDKEICSISGMGWDDATSPEDAWNYCRDTYNDKIGNLPKIEILKKLGESNGKEHGKRFEENLKLLSSVVFTKNATKKPFLTKEESDKIWKKIPGYTKKKPRKFKTIPMTKLYFLEETEHKNDEKDIDTEQLLDFESVLTDNKKADKNPLKNKGIRSKYSWNYDEPQLALSREEVKKMIGSGVNIKCARFGSDNGKEGEEYECYPKAIDCASCITFWEETKKGGEEKWLFVVGIWDQDEKNKGNIHSNVKCLKGVWFLEMDNLDLKNLWGCEDTEKDKKEMGKNIKDIHDKIEALKRFNKQRKTKKVKAQIQRAHLKGLYYYGNIEKIEERLRDKKTGKIGSAWWDDEAIKQCKNEKENMAYGGCVPLLNTLTEILTKTNALLKYTPKVQLDKAQARLQCNITGSNFRELIDRKRADGKAIFSREFTYLFRPIIPVQIGQKGGGGERRVQYDDWLINNGAIESEEDFFFENDTPYGFPIFLNNQRTIDIINKEPELKKEFINKEFYIPEIFDDIDEDPDDIEDDEDCTDTNFPELEGYKKHEQILLNVGASVSASNSTNLSQQEELLENAINEYGLIGEELEEYKNLLSLVGATNNPRVQSRVSVEGIIPGHGRTRSSVNRTPTPSVFASPPTIEEKQDSDNDSNLGEKESSNDSGDDPGSRISDKASSKSSDNMSIDSDKTVGSAFSAFDVGDLSASLESSLESSSGKGSKGYSAHKSNSKKSATQHDTARRRTDNTVYIPKNDDEEEEELRVILHNKIDGYSLDQLNQLHRHMSNGSRLSEEMVMKISPTHIFSQNRITSSSIDGALDPFAPRSPKKSMREEDAEEAPIDSWYGRKILEARDRLDMGETLGVNWSKIWSEHKEYALKNFGKAIFKTPEEVEDPFVGNADKEREFIAMINKWLPGEANQGGKRKNKKKKTRRKRKKKKKKTRTKK